MGSEMCIRDRSGITDNGFERTLAFCCGHSISLPVDDLAKRGRFISSGPRHIAASFLCFGQEGLHPTSSSVSFLCHSQEMLHVASTSGNFSLISARHPLDLGKASLCALASVSIWPSNPITFCNLLRWTSSVQLATSERTQSSPRSSLWPIGLPIELPLGEL